MGDDQIRKTHHRSLKSSLKRVNNHGTIPLNYHQAKELMIRAEEIWQKYEEVQGRLISTALNESAVETQFNAGTAVEDTYFELRSKLRPIIESLDPTHNKPSTTGMPNIKLPSIELPTFDGNIAEWTSYKDLFTAAVGSNVHLSAAQKLQYLKSSLKGEPATLLRSLATTDPNYSAAWTILNDRYDNQREIVHALINNLLNARIVRSENATDLQALIDSVTESVRALEVLKRPVSHWDDFLVVLLLNKIDSATRREWAIRQTSTSLTKFSDLITFLRSHVRGLQVTGAGGNSSGDKKRERPVKVHMAATGSKSCLICNGDHAQFQCPVFKQKSVDERKQLATKNRMCFRCLGSGHMIKACSWKGTCKVCGKRHHSLLHSESAGKPSTGGSSKEEGVTTGQQQKSQGVSTNIVNANTRAVLMTAVVHVKDHLGIMQPCRVFIDGGSEAQFISENCCRRLGLSRESCQVEVTGFGGVVVGHSRGIVQTTLHSRYDESSKVDVRMLVMGRLTRIMPSQSFQRATWNYRPGTELADPRWHRPAPVDMVIGIHHYHRIKLSGKYFLDEKDLDNSPAAEESIFGWIISGPCPAAEETTSVSSCQVGVNVDPVVKVLQQFWEMEEIPAARELSPDEEACEAHFMKTHKRDENGQFIVRVPFNDQKSDLGRTRAVAVQRFMQVERRMQRNPEFRKKYIEFMQEYESMGHMERIPSSESSETVGRTAHLPHHGVINESSTTTKLRVVFDGSAQSTTGISLNDTMMVGATVQDDLYTLLLRFRMDPVVIKADITKMFRQFKLNGEDADFHRIVWRESPDQPLVDFKLLTVTYGTASAPFLATRCLKQLAMDCESEYPSASRVLQHNAYVDDILAGQSSAEEAIKLYHELSAAVSTAGLELRKWTSNDPAVVAVIPEEFREGEPLSFDDDKTVKALGVQWHPLTDVFKFKGVDFKYEDAITKRKLLSDAARVFDPLGLISCVSVRAKMLLQDVWKVDSDWDNVVPDHIYQRWCEYKDDLKKLTNLSIPRRITVNAKSYEIHGYSDSSEKALGAIVYLRSFTINGTVCVSFITSKTRVAPVKLVSLPRLELEAAVMLAKLVRKVMECLNLNGKLILWSDSTITLTWISGSPHRWKTYVGNRVSKIQKLTPVESWRHVPGTDNPADLASRGATADELLNNEFWWKGPSWLSEPGLPAFGDPKTITGDLEERAAQVKVNHVSYDAVNILERFSSLHRLKRVTCIILRYLHNWKFKSQPHMQKTGPFLAVELHQSLHRWIARVQQQYFCEDIKGLKKENKVPASSKLKQLHPYIDNEGILRVSGRLGKADLSESRKHQIILPGESHLTTLLVDNMHNGLLHGGFQITWSRLQSEYWILRGRDKVRHFIRKCVRCRRYRAKVAEQLMGNLPSPRVTPSRPFLHTGVDYAGPFTLKNPIGRAPKTYKGYLCLFVCMTTKAIHLEPVSSLCTEGFLDAFRRFVSTRGLCAHIYSDRGTNFVGADNELQSIMMKEDKQNAVTDEMSSRGVFWHFNPPSAPHHGGLWEAGVKSAKHHLRRVVGNNVLTYEQFDTIVKQVAAVLNSRPLYSASSDPTDLEVLTPGHFLIGEPLVAVPTLNLEDVPTNRLTQYQLQQQRLQQFWRRWSAEYLNTLQQRNKWMWKTENVQCGDIVLLVEESPPGSWKMGRITETEKDNEGLVRVATVKTVSGLLKRSISKLVPLVNIDESN